MSEIGIGFHRGLSFAEYAAIPALNASTLVKAFTKGGSLSMKRLHAAVEGRIKFDETDDMRLGRAVHCRILEPERYRQDFLVASKCVAPVASRKGEACGNSAKLICPVPRMVEDQWRQVDHCLLAAGWTLRTESESGSRYYERNGRHLRVSDHPPNEATAAWMNDVRCNPIDIGDNENVYTQLTPFVDGATFKPLQFWYCGVKGHAPHGAFPPEDYIDEEQSARIERMAEELHGSPIMRRFSRKGWSEVTAVWEMRGMLMKTRIDRLDEDFTTAIDLKKMPSGEGDRETCEKKILGRRMHIQAAMNVMAVEAIEGKSPQFVWTFQDDDEPYDVQVIPANEKTIRLGKFDVNQIVGMYAAAKAKGEFRGYIFDTRVIRYGGLPDWHIAQCERAGMLDSEPAGGGDGAHADANFADFGDSPADGKPDAGGDRAGADSGRNGETRGPAAQGDGEERGNGVQPGVSGLPGSMPVGVEEL